MDLAWLFAPEYWQARFVLVRFVSLTYAIGFLCAIVQFRPLLGEHGLTPVPRFVRTVSFRSSPSVFMLHYSDRFFAVVAWSGFVISIAGVFGATDLLPLWAWILVWTFLWLEYLSIVNVGQIWYGFGWESLLLEAGFLTIFLGPAHTTPLAPTLWLFCWLLFRVEFGAGLIKLRGDSCWRDLTCLYYHHETQPIPGPLSRYFHHLPKALHKVEVLANHGAQLVLPFALFAPQPVAGLAALLIVVTQLWLLLSGNFAWLNLITITPAIAAIDSSLLGWLPISPPPTTTPAWHQVLVLALMSVFIVLSYWPVRNMLGRKQVMNRSFNRVHLVNTYGAFGSITRNRDEIILEGMASDKTWHEYEFKGKPGNVLRRPVQVAPYHLRLDWMMWFAAISPSYARTWLPRLVEKLLSGEPTTLRLLRSNPFPEKAPIQIRARLYRYRFTTREERKRTGAYWRREPLGDYLPPVSVDELRG